MLEKISDECMGEQQYSWLTGLLHIAEGEAHVSRSASQQELLGDDKQEKKCLESGINEAMKCFNEAVFTIMVII